MINVIPRRVKLRLRVLLGGSVELAKRGGVGAKFAAVGRAKFTKGGITGSGGVGLVQGGSVGPAGVRGTKGLAGWGDLRVGSLSEARGGKGLASGGSLRVGSSSIV